MESLEESKKSSYEENLNREDVILYVLEQIDIILENLKKTKLYAEKT